MTVHTVSKNNPLYVTGADAYRIPFTGLLTPQNPQFAAMEQFFLPEHRRPEDYGLAFLESPEHSLTYLTSLRQITEYRAANTDGTAVLDPTQGQMYGFWPRDEGWDTFIPANTWNPVGEGIVTEFDHPLGGKITVLEYLKIGTDGEKTPMVGLHCERCHRDPATDLENNLPNNGPQDRRWIARNARLHVRSHTEQCRPINPSIVATVTAVANDMYGTNNPVVSWESRCATTGPCAQIRSLRARGLVAR